MRAIGVAVLIAGLGITGCSSSDADLSEAVAAGDLSRVRELVADAVTVEEPVVLGMTPLMRAVNRDSTDIAAVLLDAGARVDGIGADGLTPLHIAARADAADSMGLLLDEGADPGIRSSSGMNTLDHAASSGSTEAVGLLLTRTDLDVDAPSEAITQGHGYPRDQGPTPLGMAAREGHAETIAKLLEMGAAVDAPSASGHTPLLLAIFFDAPSEVAETLLAAGADPTATAKCDKGCSTGGREPLTVVEWAEQLERTELLRLLVEG